VPTNKHLNWWQVAMGVVAIVLSAAALIVSLR
jgi:hypothetical protein